MTPELDWLKRWTIYSPNSVALKDGDQGVEWTYSELYRKSMSMAMHLRRQHRVDRGDRIAVMAQNSLEYVALFFAVQRLGAILVPINFRFTPSEVAHILGDCEPRLVVVDEGYEAAIPSNWSRTFMTSIAGEFEEVSFVGEFEDPVMILYTSGTTGFPKGAVLSHRMLFWNSINTGLRLNLTQSDVVVTFLPLFHTGGWNVLTTPCLHRGAKIVLLKKFDADQILSLSESERVTVLFGVPTTLDMMARSPRFNQVDLKSVRYLISGGEPMPLELIETWEGRGIPVRQGYGLTEFGPNVFSLNEEHSRSKMGSIGFPNFYIEARVVDDQGHDVAAGEVGELILRGPMAMSGYWRNEKATQAVMRDGWLYTGDLVRRDHEGFFFVVGRKKEMFISGGENVYPAEVERVLRSVPGVREVAVVGVPHPKWGECGRAFLSFEPNHDIEVEDLRRHCQRHLAKFKVPAEFVTLPDLPKTDSGKIAKSRLIEMARH